MKAAINQWFRSWHGAPTDPKWLAIAQRTQTNASERITAGMVSAIFWSLLDHASQAEPRGSVEKFDVESYAAFSGFSEAAISAVINCLEEKKIITDGYLTEWEKRQPKREDGSAERSKEWRERKRTQPNADEHREEKRREEENKNAVPPPAASAEADLFVRGKEVLGGPSAGGLITKLVRKHGGNIALARASIETASTKSDPREYIGAIIRGRDSKEDLRARGEAW